MVVTGILPNLKGTPALYFVKVNASPEFPDVQAC